MIIILFGVSGSGKTTVGRLLASELGWNYFDGDDFHSPANKEKMERGLALSDTDRWPWLAKLRTLIEEKSTANENVVLACSALKQEYRRYLDSAGELEWVYLKGSYELIEQRVKERHDHFFSPELLRSQFETLEDPEKDDALVVRVEDKPGEIVARVRKKLNI